MNIDNFGRWLVPLTIGAVLPMCTVLIAWAVPPALSRVLPG